MKKIIDIAPLVVFVLLVLALFSFLQRDNNQLNSVLIDKNFPEFTLTKLEDKDIVLSKSDISHFPAIVNVWATWCPSCIAEHGELTRIFETTGLRIIGVNYNDDSEAARAWLKRWGDPYAFHIVDESGTLAIDLGVYGAPETFVVDAGGVIRYRHVGVVTQKVFEETLTPLIQNLKDAS